MKLNRYWLEFERLSTPTPLNLGCGVTAYDLEDGVGIVSSTIFGDSKMPLILKIQSDVDVSLLDAKHVIPNIGDVTVRGVWFPNGYQFEARRR
jgi:hypothetical protein